MSLETIRNKLNIFERTTNDYGTDMCPDVQLLKSIARHLLGESNKTPKEASSKKECPRNKEPNPVVYPQFEKFISLMEMRDKYGDIVTPNHLGRLLKRYPDFYAFCACRVNNKYSIQPLRALHYLWDIGSDLTKLKIKEYFSKNNIATIDRALSTSMDYPHYPWWSVSYTTDNDQGYYL